MAIIEMKNVCKDFKIYKRGKGFWGGVKSLFARKDEIKSAVKDISFSIKPGELVGYIGSNGAGKSTTVKMLSGILLPTSGDIRVNGIVPSANRKQNAMNIGIVFGQRSQLNWDLPTEDAFELYRRMYRVSDAVYKRNVDMFVELMQMQDFLRKPVRQLSLGQKMRAEISIALLHDPKILYLDEPTIGLDVLVKDRIRDFIRRLNAEKKTTVILTTHDMTDIDRICDRIIMIDQGRLISDTTLEGFKAGNAEAYNVIVEYTHAIDAPPDPRVKLLKTIGEGRALFTVDRQAMTVNEILEYFSRAYKITDISIKRPEIEEIVRNLYQKMSPS
ncbi:MAG: ATP-binding cassette domain-containing protein [Oscillospiraceae bacterium]|nr:ATP-binding cassette domain-containing protein [Oscillospiraceae bacterium]